MKQQLSQFASFIGFLSLLIIVFALPMFAQEVPATDSAAILSQTVDYNLPYPGILPDNPLYVFKAMRDRIVSWFISDSKDRATFDLLQADKRLAASLVLSHQRPIKSQLIIQTISKGENYFSESISEANISRKQGIEVNGLLDNLENAAKKHEQVILGISQTLSTKEKTQLLGEASRVKDFEKQVTHLRAN